MHALKLNAVCSRRVPPAPASEQKEITKRNHNLEEIIGFDWIRLDSMILDRNG